MILKRDPISSIKLSFADFFVSVFLSFCISLGVIILIAIAAPVVGYYKGINYEKIVLYLLPILFSIILFYLFIKHFSEKVILNQDSVKFENIFQSIVISYREIVSYSKYYPRPRYDMWFNSLDASKYFKSPEIIQRSWVQYAYPLYSIYIDVKYKDKKWGDKEN